MKALLRNPKYCALFGTQSALPTALAVAVGLLAGTPSVPACEIEVAENLEVSLSSEGFETVDCIRVAEGGILNLNGAVWSVTDPGGLTCDGTINVNAILSLEGGGTSNVDGTLNINSGSTLSISGGERLSVDGALNVNAGGYLAVGETGTVVINGSLLVDGLVGIAGGGVLRLSGGGTTPVNGRIELLGPLALIEIADNDHTFAGDGRIIGRSNSAAIDIANGLTATSEIIVEGALRIRAGSGTFHNSGLVEAIHAAPGDDTLELYSGSFSGSSAAEYKVATPGATLAFCAGITITGSKGDVTVGGGTLNIHEDVCTTGNLSFTGGTINVAPGKTFKAGGSCP